MGNSVNIKGELLTLLGSKNTDGILVVELNELNQVRRCEGAAAPSAKTGYAMGCEFINTTTGATYRNTGSVTSCTFALQTPPSSGSIPLADLDLTAGFPVTLANATTNTVVRSIVGQCNATGTAITSGYSAVGVRGAVTLTGTTVGNAYLYGAQGKLTTSTGTFNTGSQVWATALLGQVDLSAATTYTANLGAICALWADCGSAAHANAITAAPTFFDVVVVANSISGFKPHSMIRVQGDGTNFMALTAWDTTSHAVDWIVTGGDTTAAAPTALKVLVGADTRYIRLHSAP
jgi:hypothetical protein